MCIFRISRFAHCSIAYKGTAQNGILSVRSPLLAHFIKSLLSFAIFFCCRNQRHFNQFCSKRYKKKYQKENHIIWWFELEEVWPIYWKLDVVCSRQLTSYKISGDWILWVSGNKSFPPHIRPIIYSTGLFCRYTQSFKGTVSRELDQNQSGDKITF